MLFTNLETLSLYTFDKDNKEHLFFIKELFFDESIKKWVQGVSDGLLRNDKKEFFGHGFLVKYNNDFIGYIGISNYIKEEASVYLRYAISKNKRGLKYGESLLSEITDYIFQKYSEVESIRLKIASDNKASMMTAHACNYTILENDLYIKYNPYIKDDKKMV